MSPNISELDSAVRKRGLDDVEKQPGHSSLGFVEGEGNDENKPLSRNPMLSVDSPLPTSTPPPLAEPGSSPLTELSPSPNPTPGRATDQDPVSSHSSSAVLPNGTADSMPDIATQTVRGEPPAKRQRLTASEKEAKAAEKEAKAAAKAEENLRKETEKKVKAEERDRKKREKDEEDRIKAEQKAARNAEKAKADAEKKARLDEREKKKREKEEEESKKERSQMKLQSFFGLNPATPKKKAEPLVASKSEANLNGSPAGTPSKGDVEKGGFYFQMFKPFFIKDRVTMAPNPFFLDDETKDAKTAILTEYIEGKRSEAEITPFDPLEMLSLPSLPPVRGRIYPNVRDIMSQSHGARGGQPIDLTTTESQNAQIREAKDALKAVPMKFIGFKEDVRPPYYGTVTSMPASSTSLRKLARDPTSRKVLPLNYDYDSEAEWQDDDGEDVDMDDEEEDLDNDEDMGDFLDDSDAGALARPAFSSGLEPQSTGICWENRQRLGPEAHMYKYRMEFILESLDHHSCIDPFSTQYWEQPATKAKTTRGTETSTSGSTDLLSVPTPGVTSSSTTTSTSASLSSTTMAPPPAPPSDAFAALTGSAGNKKSTALLAPDMQEKLKALILANLGLSRIGTQELFHAQNPSCPKAQIKATIDAIAEKKKKMWCLKDDAV